MERLKEKLIEQMMFVVGRLDYSCLNDNRIIAYSKELEALAKAYAVLEGKDVIL